VSGGSEAVARVRAYLDALEARDLARAKAGLAEDFVAVYPGDRRFRTLEELIASGGRWYRGVRKTYARIHHLPADAEGIETVILTGTLRGEWADGTAFAGIRFIDCFRLRGGLIVEQQVWNDIGEARLRRAGG
jgi:ketosteroid isomerase-like protein